MLGRLPMKKPSHWCAVTVCVCALLLSHKRWPKCAIFMIIHCCGKLQPGVKHLVYAFLLASEIWQLCTCDTQLSCATRELWLLDHITCYCVAAMGFRCVEHSNGLYSIGLYRNVLNIHFLLLLYVCLNWRLYVCVHVCVVCVHVCCVCTCVCCVCACVLCVYMHVYVHVCVACVHVCVACVHACAYHLWVWLVCRWVCLMWPCAVWGTSVTHTKHLRARVVPNTKITLMLFLFILQETESAGCVTWPNYITTATPLVTAWNYVCSVMYQLMIL